MCEPTTLAIAALATAGVGTGVSILGNIRQGEAQRAAANYQAQVAQNNAIIAGEKSRVASVAGEQQTANEGQKNRQELGAIKAAQAASGVDVNSGSSVDVRSSAAETGQLNALTVRSNAAKQAYGYDLEGAGFQADSQLDTLKGENAAAAGQIGAFSSLLSGASSLSGQAAGYKMAGVI